jgi:hypothetical protein
MTAKRKARRKPFPARQWVGIFGSFASSLRELEGKAFVVANAMRCETPVMLEPRDVRAAVLNLACEVQAQRMRAAALFGYAEAALPPLPKNKAAKVRG